MSYTPYVWHDGADGGTLVDATHLNRIEQGIQAAATVADTVAAAGSLSIAPPPSGGDDTAVLTNLINQYGTVYLQAGTYLCNLDIINRFIQPWIVGAGRGFTTLKAFSSAKPVVKFNGGSGSIAGGGIRGVTIDSVAAGGGVGLAFSGCGGVIATDVNVTGVFDESVRFWNERAGDFTEFCTFEGAIYNSRRPVRYLVSNAVESFHGTGLVGNSVIGMAATCVGPAILVENPGLPYNAPLSVTVFFQQNADQWLISYANGNAGRHASFYGGIRCENHPGLNGASVSIARSVGARVYFVGGITWLGSGNSTLGALYLAKKVTYEGGDVLAELEPVTFNGPLKNSPTQFLQGLLKQGEFAQVAVTVFGPNYHKSYLLTVYQSPYDGNGVIQSSPLLYNVDTAGKGDPVFGWSSSGLFVSNPNYTNQISVFGKATFLGAEIKSDNLAQ